MLATRPNGSIERKQAIEYFWKDDFGTGKPTTKLALSDVYLAGDLAHQEGEYEVADKGKVTTGHYVQLWMQDATRGASTGRYGGSNAQWLRARDSSSLSP